MRVVLFGNPNVGKSTVYNFLTGEKVRTGNWHGVTVSPSEWTRGDLTIVDVPGLYSLQCTSPEELVSVQEIVRADVLVQVIDLFHLERSLRLTKELAEKGKKISIILTMEDDFQKQGFVSVNGLETQIDVPVFSFHGKGKERKELFAFLQRKQEIPKTILSKEVYQVGEWKESTFEKLLYKPFYSISFFLLLTGIIFYLTFAQDSIGAWGKKGVERLFSLLIGWVESFCLPIALHDFFVQSLTAIGSVLGFLPQIFLLNAFLVFMEESGYLSILSFVSDDYLSLVGLTGRSVFSLLSGFGCTASATMTVKICSLQERKHILHLLPYLSCSAKMPVYLTLFSSFFSRPVLPIVLLYGLGIAIGLATADICPCQTLPAELTHFRIPYAKNYFKSLFFLCKSFIMKVGTVVLAFLLVSWFFSSYSFAMRYDPENGMLSELCKHLNFLLKPMGINDWRFVYALLSGLVAKENVAGILQLYFPTGLTISLPSVFSFAMCILTTSPCISAIVAGASVEGYRKAFLRGTLQVIVGLFMGYLTYFLWFHPYVLIPILLGVCFEKVYRKRYAKLKKFHG